MDKNIFEYIVQRIVNKILKEYYEKANSIKDSNILRNIAIEIYPNDRANFTPHCHIIDKQNNIEIEVSLIDYRIVNSKTSNSCEWADYKNIRDSFFEWLDLASNKSKTPMTNKEYLLYLWNEKNPNNKI